MTSYSSVDESEIEKFSRIAEEWWDPNGKFKPLHQLNPVRIEFITTRLAAHNGRQADSPSYLKDLKVLDIGCGGGLLSEPLARLGANVTGIDASEKNIGVAELHASKSCLAINYRNISAEQLAASGEQFDAVLNMEVIEHVNNPEQFIITCSQLVKPGGVMFMATVNRTFKSYALAIVGAEYILRWLPRGTHNWNRFIKPSELSKWLRGAGMEIPESAGITYNPLTSQWSLGKDIDVNYMMLCTK